ncbi:hypothetical protein GOBAR_DD12544 [Gossypium barbadense]|nr:hypothetical protein GOBAR_DD12544 [Gossypium barbadense]
MACMNRVECPTDLNKVEDEKGDVDDQPIGLLEGKKRQWKNHGPGDGKIQIQNIDVRFTKVVNLINDENHTWKEDIIEDLFTEEPAKKTLTIPLVNSSFPDKLVWRGDSTEEYSVKSGYKWCITTKRLRDEALCPICKTGSVADLIGFNSRFVPSSANRATHEMRIFDELSESKDQGNEERTNSRSLRDFHSHIWVFRCIGVDEMNG